jgi:hypothetical protein
MTTPCEQFELNWNPTALTAADEAHVRSCPKCQATEGVLRAASWQAPLAVDVVRMQRQTRQAVIAAAPKRQAQRRPGRFLTHALAAGVGAFIASGAFLSFKKGEVSVSDDAPPAVMALQQPEHLEDNFVDDGVLIEMSWPDAEEL